MNINPPPVSVSGDKNAMRNAAVAAGVGGTPLAIVAVMTWEAWVGTELDAIRAAAIGSVGAGIFSYLWHVSQRLIEKHLDL